MERELSWHELTRVIEEHEHHHNFEALKTLCKKYYPGATRVRVEATQEYNDQSYYYSFGPSSISVFAGQRALSLADDEVSLLVLLAQSPELKEELEQAQPEDPVLWFADFYYDEVYNLELCGIEKGYDVKVDLTAQPPLPTRVFIKEP